MKQILITQYESGQRFDKYLKKYLNLASASFIYKMLRKKNITLNDKKAEGNEMLSLNDSVKIFFTNETLCKFSEYEANKQTDQADVLRERCEYTNKKYQIDLPIIFENEHVLMINKPEGMLTQKAKHDDISLNEYMIAYLLRTKAVTLESLLLFKPSVCNRLDRNTTGLVVCGKTLLGTQVMSAMLKERSMHKYYRCIVKGKMKEEKELIGFLLKDRKTNRVRISKEETPESSQIITFYRPIAYNQIERCTCLEVKLVTGKTHQIRAHLASIGHPIIGDYKYGDKKVNDKWKETYGVKAQLLHAYRLDFPKMQEGFEDLSEKTLIADLPKIYEKMIN